MTPVEIAAKLRQGASRLESLNFITALTPEEKARVKSLWLNKRKGCYHLPGGSSRGGLWDIRMCIGGANRLIGTLRGDVEHCEKACRFADMMKLHFWRYKQRGAHEPTAAELNFSLERAQKDLKNEGLLVELITDQEKFLLDQKLITAPTGQKERRTRTPILPALDSLASRQIMTTTALDALRKQMLDFDLKLASISNAQRLDALQQLLSDLSKRLTDIEKFQGTLVGLLQSISYRLNESLETKPWSSTRVEKCNASDEAVLAPNPAAQKEVSPPLAGVVTS